MLMSLYEIADEILKEQATFHCMVALIIYYSQVIYIDFSISIDKLQIYAKIDIYLFN